MLDQHNLESVRISVCASHCAEYLNFDDLYPKSTFDLIKVSLYLPYEAALIDARGAEYVVRRATAYILQPDPICPVFATLEPYGSHFFFLKKLIGFVGFY